jgi:hypothetical protein
MKTLQRTLLVSAAALLMAVCARAQTPAPLAVQKTAGADDPQFKCSGTVLDGAGRLLPGATVEFWSYDVIRRAPNPLNLTKEITTATNGAFEFQVSGMMGFLVARKPGLAPAWEQFRATRDMELHLTLTPPAALAGVVVDEADKPVANAEVSAAAVRCEIIREDGARTLSSLPVSLMSNYFTARTDAAGHFRIENFPTNATAALAVQVPGKTLRPSSEEFTPGLNALPWRAGPIRRGRRVSHQRFDRRLLPDSGRFRNQRGAGLGRGPCYRLRRVRPNHSRRAPRRRPRRPPGSRGAGTE